MPEGSGGGEGLWQLESASQCLGSFQTRLQHPSCQQLSGKGMGRINACHCLVLLPNVVLLGPPPSPAAERAWAEPVATVSSQGSPKPKTSFKGGTAQRDTGWLKGGEGDTKCAAAPLGWWRAISEEMLNQQMASTAGERCKQTQR